MSREGKQKYVNSPQASRFGYQIKAKLAACLAAAIRMDIPVVDSSLKTRFIKVQLPKWKPCVSTAAFMCVGSITGVWLGIKRQIRIRSECQSDQRKQRIEYPRVV